MRTIALHLSAVLALTALAPFDAQASCGSAFCTINTDWSIQGVYADPGARAELRYEYLNQDQPREGSRSVAVGEIPAHHDEVSTLNEALFATLDYNWASGWGLSAVVPVVRRDHEHIHHHDGEAITEQWGFTELGDIRIAGRYQIPLGKADPTRTQTLGFLLGLKLPTGKTDVTNAEGELAERSLQPGTGTTDPLIGAYYQIQLPAHALSFFAQGAYAAPLNSYDDYRPGGRLTLDLGARYQLNPQLALLLQLNALWRGRDSGNQAEPDDSGGQYYFISPGASATLSRNVQLFVLAQLPIYQYVNGVQLTADWGVTGGVGVRF
jgi:hypothetical protein